MMACTSSSSRLLLLRSAAAKCRRPTINSIRSSSSSSDSSVRFLSGGAGYGNVRDQVLPTAQATEKEMFQHCKYPHTAAVISAPMTYGQPFVGTDQGPTLLREAGLRSMLSSLGWRVQECPEIDFEDFDKSQKPPPLFHHHGAKNSLIVGAGNLKLAQVVEGALKEGEFPLILGGDHSIGIGSVAAVLRNRPDVGVIWVDAHADLNTPMTSPSGNMHGMPVGLLMDGVLRPEDDMPPGCEWIQEYPRLPPDSIVYVGLRDVDTEERKLIRNLNIKAFTMTDIDHFGIGQVMDMAMEHLFAKDPDRPLHLSYDIDAVDPTHAPATGTTVRGGLTFREAHYVAEAVAATGNLASAEIVELNPNLSHDDGAKETVDLGLQIITSFMGKSII